MAGTLRQSRRKKIKGLGAQRCLMIKPSAAGSTLEPRTKMKMARGILAALCLLGLATACRREPAPDSSAGSAPGPARLAIIELPGGGDTVGTNSRAIVRDVLTARLTGADGYELVERTALDAVLREIALAKSSLAKADETIRVGRMLKADWLLLLSYPAGATNAVLSKLVHARTGVIQDLQMVPVSREDPGGAASAIAAFVSAARSAPTATKDRLWIGFGAFDDLGLYRRYKDFGERLRTALALKYAGTRVSLVERSHVRPLLDEWQLTRAGLAQGGTDTNAAQHAFVLVDGVYQAFQDERSTINLVLRMEWINGRRHAVSLKEAPGADIERKVGEAIDQFLKEPRESVVSQNSRVRRTEVQAQVRRGYELSNLPGGYYQPSDWPARIDFSVRDRTPRMRDAITAFESVLLLQPDHVEARFALAGCFADPAIDRLEDARDLWRELAGLEGKPGAQRAARSALASSYVGRDDAQALELLLALRSSTTNVEAQASLNQRIARVRNQLTGGGASGAAETIALATDLWRSECRITDRLLASSGRLLRLNETFWNPPSEYRTAFIGPNANEAMLHHVGMVVSNLSLEFPRLAPYFNGTFALSDARSPYWIARFRQTMATFARDPESIPDPKAFVSLLRSDFLTLLYSKSYPMAHEVAQVLDQWGDKYLGTQMEKDEVTFAVGNLHVREGRWDEAIRMFEKIGRREVTPSPPDDPLWRKFGSISGQRAAQVCREQMAGTAAPAALAGRTLQPLRIFPGDEVRFRFDGDRMWVGDRNAYYQYEPLSDSLKSVPLPISLRVRDIAVHGERVWFGTANGLYGVDRRTLSVVTNGVDQGLLMPSVTRVLGDLDRLWIGFGFVTNSDNAGGVGFLKTRENRFVGLMSELPVPRFPGTPRPSEPPPTTEAPPARYVTGLARSRGSIWVTSSSRLFRYQVDTGQWETSIPLFSGALARAVAANDEFVVVACREPNGRSSTETNYGGVFIYDIKRKTHRRLGADDGLPNNMVSEVALDGTDAWLGGQGFVARLDLLSMRPAKPVLFASSQPITGLEVHGEHVWFSAGPALYRVSRTGEVGPASPPNPGEAAEVKDLASARRAAQKMDELVRLYGNRDNAEYWSWQRAYRAFWRRAARDFRVLELPADSGTNRFRQYTMNARGTGVDGFRFKCPLAEPADFGWVFAHEKPSSFRSWQILPLEPMADEASWKGFVDMHSPKIAYTNAPWSGSSRSFNTTLQFLSGGLLMPGQEYFIWMEYAGDQPMELFMAFDLFPAVPRQRSRSILEGRFGLSGPPIPGAY